MYVGIKVGSTVGSFEGTLLGLGVGTLFVYEGAKVGDTVGADVGEVLGSGVVAPTVVNVKVTPVPSDEAPTLSVTELDVASTETTLVNDVIVLPVTSLPT